MMETVLNIGHGSGVTCGSALRHPLKSLETVEISPAVIEASRLFDKDSGAPLDDSRTALHLADAGLFVKRAEKSYSVIINEPSKPWAAGIGNLFSLEFYSACRRILAPDGIMAQWVHTSEMDETSFRMILRTFVMAFPDTSLWTTGANDVILIGAMPQYRRNLSAAMLRYERPEIKEDLARAAIASFAGFAALELASPRAVLAQAAVPGHSNSERFPLLEHSAPLALYLKSNIDGLLHAMDERRLALCRSDLAACDPQLPRNSSETARLLYKQFSGSHSANLMLSEALAYAWFKMSPHDKQALETYDNTAQGKQQDLLLGLRKAALSDPDKNAANYAKALLLRYEQTASFAYPPLFEEVTADLQQLTALKQAAPAARAAAQCALGKLN
ncbi:MAG TPA: hypothetical protein PLL10_10520, partial [Elusimicrobiales bacterium]|nr:hypothetical protein [Elusimicrobiales bacterium]